MQFLGISTFWGTLCMDCLLMYLHKKKANQIRSRDRVYNFLWRRKWYCHLLQVVTSSILPSHNGVSAFNCLVCDKDGLCYEILLRTHLPSGCLWHAVLLYEEIPGIIIDHNMGWEVITNKKLFIISVQNVGHCTPSCYLLLKNFVIYNTAVTNVSCHSGCGMLSSLLACLVISVCSHFSRSEASWTFPLLQKQSLSICCLSQA
jgi:hypothetical protein